MSLRAASIALVALSLTVCSNPSRNDGGIECGHDAPHVVHDGSTLVFAMSTVTIDSTDTADVPHTGFDLDGFASGADDPRGCVHADYLSVLDPETNCAAVGNEHCSGPSSFQCNCVDSLDFTPLDGGHARCFGSVDNQLPTMANIITQAFGVDVRASLSGDVARARVVVLARVTGIDAFEEDSEVHVQLLSGFAAAGTPCTAPTLASVYQIDRSSLAVGGTTEADAAVDIVGSIHGGRLRAVGNETQAFTITFPLADLPFRFALRHPVVAADIGPDGAARGNIGGWVDGEDLATEFTRVVPGAGDTVRQIVGGLADLSLGGVCYDRTATPSQLGGVSFGMGFDMVRVAIDPTNPVVDAAAPGTCGAPRDGG